MGFFFATNKTSFVSKPHGDAFEGSLAIKSLISFVCVFLQHGNSSDCWRGSCDFTKVDLKSWLVFFIYLFDFIYPHLSGAMQFKA